MIPPPDDEREGPPPATWAGSQGQEASPDTVEYDVVAEEPEPEPEPEAVEEGPEEGEEEPEAPEEAPPVALTPPPPAPAPVLTPAQGGVPPGMLSVPGADEALDDDSKPPKAGLWPRFLAASLVIVLSMAGATSISLLLYATDIARGLSAKLPGVRSKLSTVDGGGPQTILILGSDIRPAIEDKGRSDTTMLLRLDPDRDLIALLSLPRDLKVNVPGHGIGRLNEAYALGGPKLTLQAVKDVTGLRVNHLVNVDFAGFAKAVDAIGCVYVDVDRDYYHSNIGLAAEAQYAEIDVDSGYQRLCGPKALDYVRYRHEDNDIVRAARQQGFLREARAKVPPSKLWSERNDLIKIFTDYTTSDIDDAGPLIEVLKLFVELREDGVRKIEFEADIGGPGDLYVTASDGQVRRAAREFLGEGPLRAPSLGKRGGKRGGGKGGGGGGGKPALIDASSGASTYGSEFAGELHFPVYAPTKLAPGSTYHDDSHTYGVDIGPNQGYGAYKLVFQRTGTYGVPEYYGVMGTRWLDPPILENPSEVREVGGREYLLFYDGPRLRLVGWRTDSASYWVSNTLTHTLDEGQMLAIARSVREF